MDAEGTDAARIVMLRLAVAGVPRDELKVALARTSDPSFKTPTVVGNALNALSRHRDPAALVGRPQYRAALPYLAGSIADACLTRTIEALGDHSDDPTRAQLLEALDDVRTSFPDTTIAVMLAQVANGDMPSSTLCFELLESDPRFGLTATGSTEADSTATATATATPTPTATATATSAADLAADRATPEQRAARRAKREKAAVDRRKRAEVARRADEQVRRARKAERSRDRPPAPRPQEESDLRPARRRAARRATLTPAEEAEFDRDDPWVSGVVFAWVPFDSPEPSGPDGGGKARRCVVVAGSSMHLLVRPGYSEGGAKSRDWKTVALRSWKQAGFDRPTWVDVHSVRTPRAEAGTPVGWLTPEDWNALW